MPPPEAGARSLRGRLSLTFTARGGRTLLGACERSPPLHVQRPLALDARHPSLVRLVLQNATAGLFSGDALDLRVRVEAGAAVELTTATMTRAFGMPTGWADVSQRISVDAGGYLEYLPEATLLCRDAGLRQRTEVDLQPGARAALGEVFVFGRIAHGERHAYRLLDQRSVIRCDGTEILREGLLLRPAPGESLLGVLDDFAVYGGLQLIGPSEANRALLARVRDLLGGGGEAWAGASLLAAETGVAVRVLGQAPAVVQALLRRIVTEFRRCCGPAASAPVTVDQRAVREDWRG